MNTILQINDINVFKNSIFSEEDIELTCSFKLQDEETLYSIKLYKVRVQNHNQVYCNNHHQLLQMLFVRSVKGSSTITSSLTLPEEILKRVEMALIVSSDGEKHISSDCLSISAKAPKKLNRLGHSRLTAGSWGQDTVQLGTFWGVLNVSLCASGPELG